MGSSLSANKVGSELDMDVSISQSRFFSFQGKSTVRQRLGVSFDLVIEVLFKSEYRWHYYNIATCFRFQNRGSFLFQVKLVE